MGMNQFVFLEAEKTLGETMATAGLNTVMGISIVFAALILICLIISLFKFINRFEKKKAPAVEQAEAPAPVVTEVYEEELSDDGELVAAITAAIYAFEAEQGVVVSADGLVVRSIRRR